MVLGRRQSMRRTTSMTEFAVNFVVSDAEVTQSNPEQDNLAGLGDRLPLHNRSSGAADWMEATYQGNANLAPSPRGMEHRRSSADFAVVETSRFLAECGLCNRRLVLGRDIFMYRGEAFCSFECRHQRMKPDERNENCSLTSIKDRGAPATNGDKQSGNGETLAAV
ncbi:FCS-Like Zinc finger 5-like [Zingiber officinale]|uniref:FLZ-type domain-containing protein n=1 Tax=Zingiber officinale TaxID=94328 RepID=A0A8J5EP04_ZINOF|nr:FCS-Like Zinc finger 5-like [Zingiber officinale]KAG6468361.1 hypothetical protein ZIOFF_073037 [Zingiber officinale]